MQLAEHQHDHRDLVEAWRLQTLLDSGYTHHRAEQLAPRQDIDLHRAAWLLQHGCTQELALRILL